MKMESIKVVITPPESENPKVQLAQPIRFSNSTNYVQSIIQHCKENITKNKLTPLSSIKKSNSVNKITNISKQVESRKISKVIAEKLLINCKDEASISSKVNDITLVKEYSDDIFNYLYEHEIKSLPTHNYLMKKDSQFYMRPAMRAILVDWLVEVHQRFEYTTETLLLAINLLDRFLSQNKVAMGKLQLLAITSLFVAAKFEEVNLPKVSNYSYLTDGAATVEDIITAEKFMIESLDFNLSSPSPVSFMKRIAKQNDSNNDMEAVSKFLIEYTTCSSKFIDLKPSLTSGMSMYIARKVNLATENIWDNQIKRLSGEIDALHDSEFQILCKELIQEIVTPSTKLNALIKKFQTSAYNDAYNKVKDWCHNQISNDFSKLF